MNILLINHYAGSPEHGMEYRPYYLARQWAARGHNVTVVAASFSHLRSAQPRVIAPVSEELVAGIRYLWLRTPAYRGNGLDRIVNMLVFLLRLWRMRTDLSRRLRPDVVIASSTYPLDIYPAESIARRSAARLIFEVHDLWPLSPMELGGMSRWHPFIMIMQSAEDHAYRTADRVVSILPAAKGHMVEHGMEPDKFVHIPNGIDTGEWSGDGTLLPAEHATLFARLRAEKRFIVCYAGSHGIANALDNLIDAAAILHDDPIALVLVGKGPEKNALERSAAQRNLPNVWFLPPVSKSSVPALLARADALYIGAKDQPLYRFGISMNKLMDYMMSGKPIVSAIRAGNDMVGETGCGYSVPPADPAAVAAAVRTLMSHPASLREDMGRKGKSYVMQNHDYAVLAGRFEAAMTGSV